MSHDAFAAAIKKIANEAGICKNPTPHTYRRNFATHMLQSGTDLMTVKEMLGHSSLSSTTVYIHLSLVDRGNTKSPEELSGEFWAEYCERNFPCSEVQDVFTSSFGRYKGTRFVSLMARKVANAIMGCRTAIMGGHVDTCPSCD